LNPEVKKGSPMSYRVAIQIHSYIRVSSNGSDKGLAAETSHHHGSSVVSLEPTVRNRWHVSSSAG
jgi:hypothetical protein